MSNKPALEDQAIERPKFRFQLSTHLQKAKIIKISANNKKKKLKTPNANKTSGNQSVRLQMFILSHKIGMNSLIPKAI